MQCATVRCRGTLNYRVLCRSGQQVLLGDKVVVKGERLGTVAYIGKLDFDIFEQIYVGVCLDMPGELTCAMSYYPFSIFCCSWEQ